MAGRVLSIEIGNYLTKICEVDYKAKNPKIYSSFIMETPKGMIEDGLLSMNDVFINQIKNNLDEKKIKSKQVIFTLSSTKIASREVLIPFVKENRITSLIRANATDYFPIDVTKYQFAHNVLRVENDDRGIKQYRVLVLAAPNTLIDSYYSFAKMLGLEVLAIDYMGNSVFQAVKTECSAGTQMIIKVDEFSTLLMIVKDATIALTRTIPYGISEGINAMVFSGAWGEKLSYLEAMEIARRKTVINLHVDVKAENNEEKQEEPEVETEHTRRAKSDVTQALSTLVGGISRVIDYYNALNVAEPIEKFFLTGIGADFSGLSKFLTHEIGFKIAVLVKLDGINIEKSFRDASFGEYIGCIGATISPLSFYSYSGLEIKNKKNDLNIDYMTAAIGLFIFCVGVSVILGLLALVPYGNAKDKKEYLTQRKEELLPVIDIYQTYLNSLSGYEKMTGWDAMVKNPINNLVAFIEEMEIKMPSTFTTQSLTADVTGASMEVKVANKESAAKVIEQFRTFESVASVSVPSITEVQSETGETQVVFSLSIVFNPIGNNNSAVVNSTAGTENTLPTDETVEETETVDEVVESENVVE